MKKRRRPKSAQEKRKIEDEDDYSLLISGNVLQSFIEQTFKGFCKHVTKELAQEEKIEGKFIQNLKFDRTGKIQTSTNSKKRSSMSFRSKSVKRSNSKAQDPLEELFSTLPKKRSVLQKEEDPLKHYADLF